MLMLPKEPAGEKPEGSPALAPGLRALGSELFDPADPTCWLSLGRSAEHADALAVVWQRFPDLPASAPLADRMARGRERITAMRPLNDAISWRAEAERQAGNFAFVERKASGGSISERDLAILRGRDEHGYDWDYAVLYADGWYAAHAGLPYRVGNDGRVADTASRSARRRAYDVGFTAGGGNMADLFDLARRENLAALRADNQPVKVYPAMPARPLPSSWPKPTDHARPTRWSRRLLVVSDVLTVETSPGTFGSAAPSPDLSHSLARFGAEGLTIITLGASGFVPGYAPSFDNAPRSASRADAIIADPEHRSDLRALLRSREVDDILVAAQGEYLRVLDALADAFPLCRTMERTRNSLLLQRSQLRCWLDRGRADGRSVGAGHIRWGKAIKGLVGKLGEFTVRHAGPAPSRGHLVRVEVGADDLARGYVTPEGEMLEPEIVVTNKAHLRRDMAAMLRAFGGATRLA